MKMFVFRYPRNKITDLLICLFCVFLILLILQYDSFIKTASAEPEEEYVSEFLFYNGISVSDEFTVESIILSDDDKEVFADYNDIQKENGFDLEDYIGKAVKRYTFEVCQESSADNGLLLAVVFTYKGEIIGADIHSPSVDGFIRGVKNNLGEIKT